jgi:hypothetical protein
MGGTSNTNGLASISARPGPQDSSQVQQTRLFCRATHRGACKFVNRVKLGVAASERITVFCFFFSKKECFLLVLF